jgi:hypothetical protein
LIRVIAHGCNPQLISKINQSQSSSDGCHLSSLRCDLPIARSDHFDKLVNRMSRSGIRNSKTEAVTTSTVVGTVHSTTFGMPESRTNRCIDNVLKSTGASTGVVGGNFTSSLPASNQAFCLKPVVPIAFEATTGELPWVDNDVAMLELVDVMLTSLLESKGALNLLVVSGSLPSV